MSAGRGHLFTLHPCPAIYLPFFRVGVSWWVKDCSRGANVMVSHLHSLSWRLSSCSISVFPYQALLPPTGQLLCNSRWEHFLFHIFFVNAQNQIWVKGKKKASIAFETLLDTGRLLEIKSAW